MPVVIGEKVADLILLTEGKVKKNSGKKVKVTSL